MIEVFKWIKGINMENIDQVLELSSQDMTRRNRYKVGYTWIRDRSGWTGWTRSGW